MANRDLTKTLRWGADDYGRNIIDTMYEGLSGYQWSPSLTYTSKKITHEDLTDAALTQELDLNTLFAGSHEFPSNVLIEYWFLELIQEFSGGAVATATVQGGDTGDPNEGFTAENVFTGAGTGIKFPTQGAALNGAAVPFAETAYAPVLLFTTTVANVDQLDQGILRTHVLFKHFQAIGA